ncbi:conjugal transfer protein TraA [Metakosakonia massiliensis]|uniref:Pilin n=2 Tax=Phytobacter massiliensis TaxID=1485952 RepID=A0A6N3EG73_9ENTR
MANAGNALSTRKGWAVASLFCKKSSNVQMKKFIQAGGLIALALLVTHPSFAAGTDLLSSQNTTVNSTFGSGSSLVKWFYISEIIIALFTFIKVRSPLVFVGLVICIIFTRVGFSIAS